MTDVSHQVVDSMGVSILNGRFTREKLSHVNISTRERVCVCETVSVSGCECVSGCGCECGCVMKYPGS